MTTELQSLVRLASTLPSKTISAPDGSPYLTRYLLKGDFALDEDSYKTCSSVYLHQFHRPDLDRDLHSHPWPWSNSTILNGGYTELRSTEVHLRHGGKAARPLELRYRVGSVNSFIPGDYHTIVDVEPDTWTLFATGPVDRTWHFWVPGKGPIHWRDYLTEREKKRAYTAGGASS